MRRLCVLLVLPSALALPAASGAEILERVVAKVNGQIITLSDFQMRQIAAAQAARVDPANVGTFLRQNNAKILQEAVDDLLLLQKAEDVGFPKRPDLVDEAIASIKKENNITSEEQFQQALDREGLTLGELRQNIERGMIKRMVMQREIEPRLAASETEIRAEYDALKAKGELTKNATVSLQEILVKEDAGGVALARELLARARAGEDFQALARQHSGAASRANGGDLGEIAKGDMNAALQKLAFELPVGGISEPIPVEGGYRLVKVVARTAETTTPYESAKDRVRERIMMSRFEKEYDAYMQELRKGAQIELRVREVPLQLTGPIPEGSLLEALEPLGPGPGPGATAPTSAPAANTTAVPAERKPSPPAGGGDEITTTPQAAPEHVTPPPAPARPSPAGDKKPTSPPPGQ